MARDLLGLIRASGYAGVSGQNFLNHVTGAASGVGMVDYNIDSWAWDGASGPIGAGWPYASGTSWTIPITFTEGAKARLIRRLSLDGLGYPIRVVSYSADMDIVGENIEITARTLSNSSSSGDATLSLISSMPPTGQTISYTTYAAGGYTSPYDPPGAGVVVDPIIELTMTSPGSPRNVTYTINIDYICDIAAAYAEGPYNPTLTKQYIVQATDRTVLASDLDVQWSYDQSTIESAGGYIFYLPTQGAVGDDYTIYYRWRLAGSTGSYSAWQTAYWEDPRFV